MRLRVPLIIQHDLVEAKHRVRGVEVGLELAPGVANIGVVAETESVLKWSRCWYSVYAGMEFML